MKTRKVIQEIRDYLIRHSDQKLVEKYSRYFGEGYDSYGISTELFHELLKAVYLENVQDFPIEDLFLLGEELIASGKYEEGSLAICLLSELRKELVKANRKKKKQPEDTTYNIPHFDRQMFAKLKAWFDNGIRNWAHTDMTCSILLGQFLVDKSIKLTDFSEWKKSSSKWTRRAVPVSMIALLKQETDFAPLLKFIDDMMMDDQRPVRQGLGWLLRETWKKEPQLVEEFLMKWKEEAPRLIFQYATEKMDKKYRERFRKTKKKLA